MFSIVRLATNSNDVKSLSTTDCKHLEAANGWLELGNIVEAANELEQITPLDRVHPDVLHLRWQIYAKAGKWDVCLDIGRAMTKFAPDLVQGWVNLGNALFYMKRYGEAFDALYPALELFPQNAIIRFNLACYQCKLERLNDAYEWLAKAIELGGKPIKLMALDDPELRLLWERIGEI